MVGGQLALTLDIGPTLFCSLYLSWWAWWVTRIFELFRWAFFAFLFTKLEHHAKNDTLQSPKTSKKRGRRAEAVGGIERQMNKANKKGDNHNIVYISKKKRKKH